MLLIASRRGDLEERFAPGRTPSKSAQELKARSDQNFHSVNVLCCERCYQYDCVLHGKFCACFGGFLAYNVGFEKLIILGLELTKLVTPT